MTEMKQLKRKTELLTRRLDRIRAQKEKETIRLNELMAEVEKLRNLAQIAEDAMIAGKRSKNKKQSPQARKYLRLCNRRSVGKLPM